MNKIEQVRDALESVKRSIAFDVQDWSTDKRLAWIYGIIMGWGDASDEVARKHRWTAEDVATMQRHRAAIAILKDMDGQEPVACELRDIYEAALASKDAEIEAIRNPWISVKDRLPIKERWVIVVADGAMNCAWYDKKRGWHNGFNERPKNIRIEEITHWMPLPTPPKP